MFTLGQPECQQNPHQPNHNEVQNTRTNSSFLHANIWYFMSSLIYKVGFCFANLFPQKCLLLSTCYCGLTSLLNVRCCFPTFHSGFKKLHIKCTRTWSIDIFYCFSVLPLAINAALPVRPSVRLPITLFCLNWLITGSINTLK